MPEKMQPCIQSRRLKKQEGRTINKWVLPDEFVRSHSKVFLFTNHGVVH